MSVPLFTPMTFRGLTIRNRIGVSPMCQYSSQDGFANDWHLVHVGSRALGGAGMVIMEATGVTPKGRITPLCHGIWKDAHIDMLKRITAFSIGHGAAIGIQLAHAGRKASMAAPWEGGKRLKKPEGGWTTIAPSPLAFSPDMEAPHEMSLDDIKKLKDDFVAGARRAVQAGFQILEIHGAHGYLLHEFYSPLSNKRTDEYGGSEENRFRLICEIARAIRAEIPQQVILAVRLSCSDWQDGGVTIDDTVRLSAALKKEGVDFIDCSSGALTPDGKIPVGPNYQVPFAKAIKDKATIPTAAVGMINEPAQANDIIKSGEADMVFLARAMLRDPYWPLHAADVLGAEMDVPVQYLRGYRAEQLARPRQKKVRLMQANPSIRLFTQDEWPLYKTVRLKALQSDPKVFGSSYAREEPRPDTEWRQALERKDMAVFGIFDGEQVIGMTGVVIDKDDPTIAKLWGSWLEPAWRSKGVSEDMYRARIDWAREHETAKKIVVAHRASNIASKKANQKHGFVMTGSAPHLWHDGVTEDEVFYELVLKG